VIFKASPINKKHTKREGVKLCLEYKLYPFFKGYSYINLTINGKQNIMYNNIKLHIHNINIIVIYLDFIRSYVAINKVNYCNLRIGYCGIFNLELLNFFQEPHYPATRVYLIVININIKITREPSTRCSFTVIVQFQRATLLIYK